MAKYTGKDMVVKFGTVSVSGQGRNLEISQSGDEIDVTTYGSTDKEFITGLADRSATLEVLDDNASTLVRNAMRVGSVGSLTWFPQGTASGKPQRSVGTATVTSADESYPYDDAVLISVGLRLNGSVTEGVAP